MFGGFEISFPAFQYLATAYDVQINRGVEIKVLTKYYFYLAD